MFTKDILLDNKLVEVSGSVYFSKDNTNFQKFSIEDIVSFHFLFNGLSITLKGNNNGDGIIICKDDTLHDIDMEEHGYLKVVSLINILKLESYIGLKISDIQYVVLGMNEIGVVIVFSKQKRIIVLNLDDELFCFKDLPKYLVDEGYQIIKK